MGWLGTTLGKLFSGGGSQTRSDNAIYLHVRCNACDEVIRARINPSAELSLADDGTYFVRKVLVGQQCFRPIEAQLRYADRAGKQELSREVRGGTVVEPGES